MKKCNTELMKELKELQNQIEFAQQREDRTCVIRYGDNDKNEVVSDYDYDATRNNLAELQKEERRLKGLLAYSNATTKVEGFDMTIAEALVYLAQMSQNKARLTRLAGREKISRDITGRFGYPEYTRALYDIKKAQADLADVNRKIASLQMAIDRINLSNMIDC